MPTAHIHPYHPSPPACYPYDPRAPVVAQRVADLITAELPSVTVEHVGSTAVPECAGKGIVDVMVLYPNGQLQAVKAGLAALGFQRQTVGFIFPEDRPMRVGAIEHDGSLFRIHAHVLVADAADVHTLRAFRDRLRADPELLAAYVAYKQAITAAGVTEAADYTKRKSAFIHDTLTAR